MSERVDDRVFRRLTVESCFSVLTEGAPLVSWAMQPTFIAPGPWTFELQRSFNASDDFTTVAITTDQPWAYDRQPSQNSALKTWYRVRLTDGNQETYISQSACTESYWDRYDWTLAREIVRKEHMLQRKRVGTKGWLLKRRWWGDRCACTDPVTGQVQGCLTCFGTGVEGGYYSPLEYWVTMNPSQQLRKLTPQGLMSEVIETVRSLAYPLPELDDIWVHATTGVRYHVEGDVAAIARHRGIPLILQVRLTELNSNHPVYGVPVNASA